MPSLFALLRIVVGALINIAMPIVYVPDVFAGGVSAGQVLVVLTGGAAVLMAVGLTWRHWRADATGGQAWLFPALLVLFGLGACVLAALGRAASGLFAMTASRYLVFTACFWVGLLLLLALRDDAQSAAWRRTTRAMLVALTLGLLAMWPRALPYMAADADGGWHAREELRRGHAEAATVLFPNGLELDRMRQVLERYRLSIYRPQ